jgi:hypothetical protein
VFDVSQNDGREHFLCLIMLAQMDAWAHARLGEGFATPAEIVCFMQDVGFQPSQIEYGIRRAVAKRLLELNSKTELGEDSINGSELRITTAGVYCFKKLVRGFGYIDAVVVDTPICSSNVRRQLIDARSIHDRLVRANRFVDYLDEQWRPLGKSKLPIDWRTVSQSLRVSVQVAKSGASKNR